MKHYLFEDMESREEFIVCACDLEEAKGIAADNFERPKFQYRMSELEAETSGLDEYQAGLIPCLSLLTLIC